MIVVGSVWGGPEFEDVTACGLHIAASCVAVALHKYCPGQDTDHPGMHVRFFIPGSSNSYADVTTMKVIRYSMVRNAVLVHVSVPPALVPDMAGSLSFFVESLRKANELGRETLARKGGDTAVCDADKAVIDDLERILAVHDHALRRLDESAGGYR
jgi:hypothetical protein